MTDEQLAEMAVEVYGSNGGSWIAVVPAILADVRRLEEENASLREQLSKVQSELKDIQSYLRENDE